MQNNPTTDRRQVIDLVESAQAAQDAIGWADSRNADEMGSAVLGLARQVVALAREVSALQTAAEYQQTVIDGQAEEIAKRIRELAVVNVVRWQAEALKAIADELEAGEK